MISIRRFFDRPSAVSLDSSGFVSAYPATISECNRYIIGMPFNSHRALCGTQCITHSVQQWLKAGLNIGKSRTERSLFCQPDDDFVTLALDLGKSFFNILR